MSYNYATVDDCYLVSFNSCEDPIYLFFVSAAKAIDCVVAPGFYCKLELLFLIFSATDPGNGLAEKGEMQFPDIVAISFAVLGYFIIGDIIYDILLELSGFFTLRHDVFDCSTRPSKSSYLISPSTASIP